MRIFYYVSNDIIQLGSFCEKSKKIIRNIKQTVTYSCKVLSKDYLLSMSRISTKIFKMNLTNQENTFVTDLARTMKF